MLQDPFLQCLTPLKPTCYIFLGLDRMRQGAVRPMQQPGRPLLGMKSLADCANGPCYFVRWLSVEH